MTAFIGVFRRDLGLALRQGGDTGLVLGFFVLAVVLFPLGVGPEPAILQRIGAEELDRVVKKRHTIRLTSRNCCGQWAGKESKP